MKMEREDLSACILQQGRALKAFRAVYGALWNRNAMPSLPI